MDNIFACSVNGLLNYSDDLILKAKILFKIIKLKAVNVTYISMITKPSSMINAYKLIYLGRALVFLRIGSLKTPMRRKTTSKNLGFGIV